MFKYIQHRNILKGQDSTFTHTHTHTHYIYIYMLVLESVSWLFTRMPEIYEIISLVNKKTKVWLKMQTYSPKDSILGAITDLRL